MLGHDRRLTCPTVPDQVCPWTDCPGRSDPDRCRHLASLTAWRALSAEDQQFRLEAPRPAIDPAVRDAVNSCPDRGPVLPLSLQGDCGCRGREVSECRAGRGQIAGRVTLRDCLECRGG